MKRSLLTLLLILAVVPCGSSQSANQDDTRPLEQYVLGVGDRLRVTWLEDAAQQAAEQVFEREIRMDGKIFLPIIGEVMAEGRTIEELQHALRTRLADVVVNPRVYVELMQGTGAYLLGAVREQGFFPIRPDTRLTHFLAMHSGFTPAADLSRIVVVRSGQELIRIDLANYFETGAIDQDLVLQTEDRIYVPELEEGFVEEAMPYVQLVLMVLQTLTLMVVLGRN